MKDIVISNLLGTIAWVIASFFIHSLQKEKYSVFSIKKYSVIVSILYFIVINSYTINNQVLYIILVILCVLLLVIDIIDTFTMVIPNILLCILGMVVILYSIEDTQVLLFERIIGIGIVSLPMIGMNLCFVESFGGGDIKLVMIIGGLLGYQKMLLSMLLAIIGGGIHIMYIRYIKKQKVDDYVPFAPYLCKSIIFVIFFGKQILEWYFWV